MRWFKHFTNARHNPKFRAIEKKLGEAGYARACKLLEIIGERGGVGKDFAPRLDLNESHTDLGWLADEMEIDRRSAKFTLRAFAKCKFIDPVEYQRNTVYVPQMIEYLDEWTRKRQPRDSVATPESLQSNSPQSRSRVEEEAEVEGATATAAAILETQHSEAWKAIGQVPCGPVKFQRVWEATWRAKLPNEKTSDAMERCIIAYQRSGISAPPPFFAAKRRVENGEAGETGNELSKYPLASPL